MKQELTAFVWPALVGVLAAALILDKWVLEPQETMNAPVNGGYRDAVALATPSVVNIYTAKLVDARTDPRLNSPIQRRMFSNRGSRQRIERSLGSGVILSAAGHIVTNNHVIAGADAIQVLLADGRSASASVVGSDPETDLAILHIDLPELKPSALADADSDILQKLGGERLVSMAVRAETPPMRAATITFVSKLARDSDTHEEIIDAGGLELLLGMILRLNEEAVWGLASMASVEDNWDAIEEVFDDEGVESVRDLLEMAGDYGQEGAAWAVCYMSGHPALQVKLVRGNLLPALIQMVKNGTRRGKKAAERALKAMATGVEARGGGVFFTRRDD